MLLEPATKSNLFFRHSVQAPKENALTLPQIFFDRVIRFGSKTALLSKNPLSKKYEPISWKQWDLRVRQTAWALLGLGVKAQARIGLLSENRPEWTYVDLGALSLGAVVVPIYPTSSLPDVAHILENAGIEVLFLSSQAQWERLQPVLSSRSNLKVIIFDPASYPGALSFKDFLLKGKAQNATHFESLLKEGNPEDLATIIYTSGTTGLPKGVMLTHRNFVANYLGASERINLTEQDAALSFLPLSHIFERLAGYYFMAFHGASIAYAESMQTVAEDIQIIRPTVCAAVPRFYEKIYGKILEQVEAGSSLKKAIFNWAVAVGRKKLQGGEGNISKQGVRGKSISKMSFWLQYALAKALVFNKVKRRLGGRIRFFISGGAPLSKELAEFFYAADVLILEGYGLTETSPVITVNTAGDFKFGTVGKPLPNVKVRLAEDGEILTRGPCVMKGYYGNPQATAETIQEGWLHTGDIGTFDGEFLKITDRKKDIIATSGGKKISPQNIENRILADSLFQQVVIVGDKKNYLVALVVPNRQQVLHFAAGKGIDATDYPALLRDPKVRDWIEQRFQAQTQNLASYEQIKYYSLLPKEFTLEGGELTPTLKYKRRLIMEKYQDLIDAMYVTKNLE